MKLNTYQDLSSKSYKFKIKHRMEQDLFSLHSFFKLPNNEYKYIKMKTTDQKACLLHKTK